MLPKAKEAWTSLGPRRLIRHRRRLPASASASLLVIDPAAVCHASSIVLHAEVTLGLFPPSP
jgi:hypothetical protein